MSTRENIRLIARASFVKSFGVPAWCKNKPKLLFDLHSGKKSEVSY